MMFGKDVSPNVKTKIHLLVLCPRAKALGLKRTRLCIFVLMTNKFTLKCEFILTPSVL